LFQKEIVMNEFKTYHPIVNFAYFAFVIGYSCFFMHPVCLAISLASALTYCVMLRGVNAVRTTCAYTVPMLLITALINPVFSHEGATVIAYLPGGNPLTLESIVYGLCAALMLASVICHFSCLGEVITSDKFIWLFARIMPAMSLVLSMTLRFVPRFTSQLRVVDNAQRCMGRDAKGAGVIKRAKYALRILSVMTSWAFENSIDTADSMKARGYGTARRTSFSIFAFDKRDKKALLCILFLGLYTLGGSLWGAMNFRYFPSLKASEASPFGMSVFLAYFLLCACPVIIEILEVRRWNASRSKI